MTLNYLLDENVDRIYRTQLLQQNLGLVVLVVGDSDAPPKRTLDPEILCWCEENNFVLEQPSCITYETKKVLTVVESIRSEYRKVLSACNNLSFLTQP